ncbi:MAG: NTP transferase domain-containing protein [Candidatus Diapherotrites archaeon]|nr:NTP transferase domain-containing protein [Candidatus Diapherotrites archaeon]
MNIFIHVLKNRDFMGRERVTITIKDDLLKQVDRLVDGMTIRSRSQAMEHLLSKFLSDYKLKTAFVLAGGRKSAMLLNKQAKFLAKIQGRTVIENVMENIHEYNVNNFIVYTDSFAREITKEIREEKMPFSVNFIVGEKPCGTIKPLLMAKPQLKDTFLVAYADTIASINLNDMLSFHRKNNALATIALTTVSNPKDFGVAVLQGNKITEFSEKPKTEAHSYLINAGYFLLEPEIFKHLGKNMNSIEKDLFPKLAERGLLYGYPFQGKYFNINNRKDLERARMLL